MLGLPGREDASVAAPRSAALLPRTPIATGRQVLLLEANEPSRLHAHRLLHDAGLQVDAVATLAQARAALRDRTPDVFVTGLGTDAADCAALVDELRVVQPRLRVIELVDDDSAFALSLPGAGQAGRVGRSDMGRTLVAAVSQELDAAWAGLAG
jgi:DNA-binding NarL/FixJ family response regulator